MSIKTNRLIQLLPQVYAADDAESMLYKLLDAIGYQFTQADETIKQLLKSHWVDYAEGKGLDGLSALYGIERRRTRGGQWETDDQFRQRLKSTVPLFTAGGTRQAIIGAVRTALGLPFDLSSLQLPPQYDALIQDLEHLVYLEEFSPKGERLVENTVSMGDGISEAILVVDIPTVREQVPTINWRFTRGSGHHLSIELLPVNPGDPILGVKAQPAFRVNEGDTLSITTLAGGQFSATIGFQDVSDQFTDLDGSSAPVLPPVPLGRSEWRFRATSAQFDLSAYGPDETFDQPQFEIEMNWVRYEPLTFDVHLPYFIKQAVDDIKVQHNYTGRLFQYEGLSLEAVAAVVDQTRAAGVKGNVQYSLNFFDDQQQSERFTLHDTMQVVESADVLEEFSAASVNELNDSHDVTDHLVLGGVFDIASFDGHYGFVE